MTPAQREDSAAGRDAYRESLAQNHAGVPCHGRKTKPLTAAKRAELTRIYDLAMSESPAPA